MDDVAETDHCADCVLEGAEKQFTTTDTARITKLATFLCQIPKDEEDLPAYQELLSRELPLLSALLDMLLAIVADNGMCQTGINEADRLKVSRWCIIDDMAACIVDSGKMEVLLNFVEKANSRGHDAKELEEVKGTLSQVIVYAFGSGL